MTRRLAGCTTTTDDAAGPSQQPRSPDTVGSATTDPLHPAGVHWTAVADEVEASVVSIEVRGQTGGGEGSGVVIDDGGHVPTNHHVIVAAIGQGQARVALADGRVFGADVVGTDPDTDLAVLQMREQPDDVRAIGFADSETVQVGQPVMALGNPLGRPTRSPWALSVPWTAR